LDVMNSHIGCLLWKNASLLICLQSIPYYHVCPVNCGLRNGTEWNMDHTQQADLTCRFEEARLKLQEVNDHRDLEILRQAQVIGLTTSGLADKQSLIASLGPKVLTSDMQCACTYGPTEYRVWV
jgi:hypothetical protein